MRAAIAAKRHYIDVCDDINGFALPVRQELMKAVRARQQQWSIQHSN